MIILFFGSNLFEIGPGFRDISFMKSWNLELGVSAKTILMNEQLVEYLRKNSVREPEVLIELREETQKLPNSGMQISPEQGPDVNAGQAGQCTEDCWDWNLHRVQLHSDGFSDA